MLKANANIGSYSGKLNCISVDVSGGGDGASWDDKAGKCPLWGEKINRTLFSLLI